MYLEVGELEDNGRWTRFYPRITDSVLYYQNEKKTNFTSVDSPVEVGSNRRPRRVQTDLSQMTDGSR